MKPAHFGAATVDLSRIEFTPDLLECIPAEVARKYQVMPVVDTPFKLAIAVADAGDLVTLDAITHFLNREMEIRVADKSQLEEYVRRFYGAGSEAVVSDA